MSNPHIFSMEDFDEIAGLSETEGEPEETSEEEAGEEVEDGGEETAPETPEEGEEEEDTAEDEEEPEPQEDTAEESEEDGQGEDVPSDKAPDLEVQAYLAKYDGDETAALKGAVELQRVLGRQGRETAQLRQQVEELNAQLQQAEAFTKQSAYLTQEQQTWVEGALESGNPQLFVQQAVQVGEFDLARALADRWGEDQPYHALRAAQLVDAAEYQAQMIQPQPAPVYEHPQFIADLTAAYPEMPSYEPQMVTIVKNLGEQHPLVAASRSPDPNEAARGLIGIYEIARASSASVRSARDGIKRRKSQDGTAARQAAMVTSGQASPTAAETPRPRMIAPGLTLEALDAVWDEHSK